MKVFSATSALTAALALLSAPAGAVSSAELYTTAAYQYGRFEARVQFAFGDGVISSFFLWKDGSEQDDVFWNELDFEKLRANCEMETNAIYGLPEMGHHAVYDSSQPPQATDLCGEFHTYAYEWTADYIAWFIDGVEIRRETGATAAAFRDNAAGGMQIHFNIWPGNAEFGGNFNPSILPLHQFINWVQYSSYSNGTFQEQWREDFDGNGVPSGWATGSWGSPKNLSTHTSANVTFKNGYAILSLTADDATGSAGVNPMDTGTEPMPEPSATAPGSAMDAGSPPSSSSSAAASATTSAPAPSASEASSAVATASTEIPPSASSAPPATTASANPSAAVPSASVPMMASASPSAPPATSTGAIASASPSVIIVQDVPKTAEGCDCHVAQKRAPSSSAWFAGLAGLALVRLRRAQTRKPLSARATH